MTYIIMGNIIIGNVCHDYLYDHCIIVFIIIMIVFNLLLTLSFIYVICIIMYHYSNYGHYCSISIMIITVKIAMIYYDQISKMNMI